MIVFLTTCSYVSIFISDGNNKNYSILCAFEIVFWSVTPMLAELRIISLCSLFQRSNEATFSQFVLTWSKYTTYSLLMLSILLKKIIRIKIFLILKLTTRLISLLYQHIQLAILVFVLIESANCSVCKCSICKLMLVTVLSLQTIISCLWAGQRVKKCFSDWRQGQ